jgi:ribosomal protein S24E
MNAPLKNMIAMKTQNVLIQSQDINVSANLDSKTTVMEENVKVMLFCFCNFNFWVIY